MSIFSARNIRADYGAREILHDISFDIDTNCVVGLLGANASGKSTLIKSICGILPHKGECFVDSAKLEKQKPREIAKMIGYIPQRSGISNELSVFDTVLMGFNPYLPLLGEPNLDMRKKAEMSLIDVGLEDYKNVCFGSLSEGQKQMCAWARVMMTDCKMLIMDEPESALDFSARYRFMNAVYKWTNADKRCALVALHDPQLALNKCDRLIILNDGRIIDYIDITNDDIEKSLSMIYGSIRVHNIDGQYVMLWEDKC